MIHYVLDLCCTGLGNNFHDRGVVGKFPQTRKGIVRGSEVTNHDQNEPRPDVGTLWNSSEDWGKVRETIKAKLDMLAISKCDLQDQRLFYSLGMLP